jgi:hypothetical protein
MQDTAIDPCWFTCPLCGFKLHNNGRGRYNHMMRHVRAGEVKREPNPLYRLLPYRFSRVISETR